jgi:hypothetical protein
MQKVLPKSLVESGKIIFIYITGLTKPKDGMVIRYIERSDIIQKTVYTRYVGEQHVREDCDGQIPSASDWIKILMSGERPTWVTRTQRLQFED